MSASSPARRLAMQESAAGVGALRRGALDAGHDGHRAQSRLNDQTVEALELSGDRRFAWRQLSPLHHYVFRRGAGLRAPSLRGHPRHFRTPGYSLDTDLTAEDWVNWSASTRSRCARDRNDFRRIRMRSCGRNRRGVFILMNARAVTYRNCMTFRNPGAPRSTQAMVFGNMGDTSATGVAFTRNSTGEQALRRVPDQRAGRRRRR